MSYEKQMPGYIWGKFIHGLHPDGAMQLGVMEQELPKIPHLKCCSQQD